MKTQSRPAVVFFATGGTIASTPDTGSVGAVPTLRAQDLVASVPGLRDFAEIECVQHAQKPSVELDFDDVVGLAAACRAAAKSGAAGLIVAQGTDTIEETSYALDLLWDRPEPIVVTGSMRNPSLAGSDGPANILAAAQVAAGESARGRGVLVVLNDEIHAARDVVKTHTSSTSAFRSWRGGPLGVVHEGEARFHAPPIRYSPIGEEVGRIRAVALVRATLADRMPFLEALPAWGYEGLVIEAFGGGHLRQEAVPVVRDLARRMPVILASRTGAGDVLAKTYAFPGSETELLAAGLIPAGSMHPLKARVLLTMLMSTGASNAAIRAEFVARG